MRLIVVLLVLGVGVLQCFKLLPAFGQGTAIERYQKLPTENALTKTIQNKQNAAAGLFNQAVGLLNTPEKALKLFQEAGALGLAEAQYNVGVLLSKDKINDEQLS